MQSAPDKTREAKTCLQSFYFSLSQSVESTGSWLTVSFQSKDHSGQAEENQSGLSHA